MAYCTHIIQTKLMLCGLKMYEQLDGKQCVDCYALHKYERMWNMLMEFSDTDLKSFEDCGCESNKWWPVYHTIAVFISCLLDCYNAVCMMTVAFNIHRGK